MNLKLPLVVVFCAGLAASVSAADSDPLTETVLIPIAFGEEESISGAMGTVWSGELWLHNASGVGMYLQGWANCLPACGVPSGYIGRYPRPPLISAGNQGGALLYVNGSGSDEFFITNRIFETTAGAQPRGVEIPVVRENDFLAGPVELLGVDVSGETRIALRVYDPRRQEGSAVRVEILAEKGTVIGSTDLPLQAFTSEYVPHFGAIFDLLNHFPEAATEDVVHVRLTPLASDMDYWAFLSVTDNETQHVAIVSPQK